MSETGVPVKRSGAAPLQFGGVAIVIIGLYALLPWGGDHWWIGAVVGLIAIGAIVPITSRRLRAVQTAEKPILVAAEGIAMLLMMVLFGFSAMYLTLDQRAGQFDGLETRVDAVYFTVTTLSTVGFGDITATGQAARVLVTLQVLFDLTLLGVAVRVLGRAAKQRRATN